MEFVTVSIMLSLSNAIQLETLCINFNKVQFQGPYLKLLIGYISKILDL